MGVAEAHIIGMAGPNGGATAPAKPATPMHGIHGCALTGDQGERCQAQRKEDGQRGRPQWTRPDGGHGGRLLELAMLQGNQR